jgi:hypothetical protein
MFDVDLDVSPDRLEQVLLADEQLIARIRIHQAKVLAALDVAQVPLGDGAGTLAEWIRARLDVTDSTARDLVTAARTMPDQPVLQDLVEVGVSFDRLVATSRLVTSGADPETVSESFRYDLIGVVRLRERHRAISRKDEAQSFRDRYLVLQPSLDGSRGTIRGELPAMQFMTVEEALTRRADQFRRAAGSACGALGGDGRRLDLTVRGRLAVDRPHRLGWRRGSGAVGDSDHGRRPGCWHPG